ncbi:MAG: hypothetical protein ACI8TX_003372 [Hyphomicrobiaceae bacterium]
MGDGGDWSLGWGRHGQQPRYEVDLDLGEVSGSRAAVINIPRGLLREGVFPGER